MNSSSREIETRLQAVRSRIRRVQRLRAAMVVATVALGGLFAMMAADYFFTPLPLALRWGMLGLWLVAVGVAAVFGCRPLAKPISLLQVARWLEARHPEIEERLSTVLELAANGGGVSPELLASLARAAKADAAKMDATVEVKATRTTRRWGRPAVALAAMMAMILAVWPGEASRLIARAVVPFSSVGNSAAGRFEIKPGDLEVLEGDAVRIEASYDGRAKQLELAMDLETGQQISQGMTQDNGVFQYTLNPARNSFRYRARAGREESDGFAITVWPMPKIEQARAKLDFPPYTGVLPEEDPLDQGIRAVAGTQVTLAGRTNTAVESAWLEMSGKRLAEGTVEAAANGGRIGISWTLAAGGSEEAVVRLKHRLGREIEALRFAVEVLEDLVPEVVLLSPMQRDLKVRPDEVLELKYEVTEDFAVAKLAVEVMAGGKQAVLLDQTLPPRIAGSKPPRFRGEAQVAVGELKSRFPGTNEIRLRIMAADARPATMGGPGMGYSEWLTLRIDQSAESLARQELREQHDGAKQTIEEAIRATREARERMDWHREEIKKGALSENARKNLKEAGEQLATTEDKLEELAKQMKEGVHALKSDEIRKASETVAKAREELENSPLQDEAAERDSKLQAARNAAESAVKQLENVRNAMDREREKIDDLARVQDLAQQQQEVARQAAADLAESPTAAPAPQAWQEQQKRVEDSLRQQLRERPEAKAEALTAQAEQAKALAQQAHAMAKSQQALGQQAQQPSEKSLQQALAAEQTKIAAEANTELALAREARNALADRLPEATAAAESARDEIQQGETQAAADSAQAAAQAMRQAAQSAEPEPAQAESLEKLAGRQSQVADAIAALAKGDPAGALKDLQAAQAEAAGELAGAVQNLPQIDGTGSMRDATNAAKQGAEQAQAAAQQGPGNPPQEAAKQHAESGQNFEKSAQALTQAADELSKMAATAAAQAPNAGQAPVSASALAEAFQQAAQAADNPQPAAAAAQAARAAQALSQAAQAGLQQMQGRQPGPPGPQGPPGAAPGEKPEEGPREAEADPGVPPELAKLGISAADWEKIQATLKSDVGAGEGGSVPEEYRELVKNYFESISKKSPAH